MLTLQTHHENVGGVARVVAIPTNAFSKMYFNFLTRRRSLVLTSTTNCIEIECNRNEEVSDAQQTSDEGIFYNHQFKGKIFSLDIEREDILQRLINGKWLLLVTSANGVMKLYGSTDVPLQFTYTQTFGKYGSAPQSVSYQFASTQARPAVIIDSAPV